MTDFQKEQAIHDWILSHVSYDYSLQKRTAYDALTTTQTVCQGYAMLMEKMLTAVGIPTKIVTGNIPSGYHAWNLVQIGGNWYHVDATNDDANTDKTIYYNKTDDYMTQHNFVWDKSKFPQATTLYDGTASGGGTVTSTVNPTDLANANTAVQNYQKFQTNTFALIAQQSVDKLPVSTEKTQLQATIDGVKKQVENTLYQNANTAVTRAEQYKHEPWISYAQKSIDQLTNFTNKTALQTRLNAVKVSIGQQPVTTTTTVTTTQTNSSIAIASAQLMVRQAQTFKSQLLIDKARQVVNNLIDSPEKTTMLNQLTDLENTLYKQKQTNATNAVSKAEKYRYSFYVKSATTYVNILNDTDPLKAQLLQRLNAIK